MRPSSFPILGALAAVSAMAATPAAADDAVIAARFGNTFLVRDQTGLAKYYYAKDRTFTGVAADGTPLKGTWRVGGPFLCLTFTQAPKAWDPAVCNKVEAHKLGESWSAGPYQLSLVRGVQ